MGGWVRVVKEVGFFRSGLIVIVLLMVSLGFRDAV